MWIKNVKLEKGFYKENGLITSTITELADLYIEDGKIVKIEKSGKAEGKALDAKGYLALPTLKDNPEKMKSAQKRYWERQAKKQEGKEETTI